jgi:AraC-like DNA-binding protein
MLRDLHQRVFSEWLLSTLEQRHSDLSAFLHGVSGGIPLCLTTECYSRLVSPFAPEPERRLFLTGLGVSLAAIRNESSHNHGHTRWRVHHMLVLYERNCGAGHLTLRQVARQMGVSEDYLARLFKEQTGLAGRRYQMLLRILRATELLRDSRQLVKQMAASLGYTDSSNFVREFRDTLGVTPGQFRARSGRAGPHS